MHGHDKGPLTAIAIELSNLSEIVNVQVKIPITLLPVHDVDHHDYHVVSGNWFYDFFEAFRDCNRPIRTTTTFELGLFQCFKLRRILRGQYFARIVAFQNDAMIPLSHIEVCNHSHRIESADISITTTASCPLPAATSSGLYPSHAIYQHAEPNHNIHNTDPTVTDITPTVTIQTPFRFNCCYTLE